MEDLKEAPWRAENEYTSFYCVERTGTVSHHQEFNTVGVNNLYNCGNYFQHRSDAEMLAERLRDTIRDFRNEAGL